MGRKYVAVFEEVAVSVIQDLFELLAPSDGVVLVHSVIISQSNRQGDAQAEQLNILMHTGTATGTGGTTVTPTPLSTGDPAFGGVVEANNTTQSAEGNFLHAESWNVQIGFFYLPPPEDRIEISPSDFFIVELQSTPSASMTMSGSMVFEALGG